MRRSTRWLARVATGLWLGWSLGGPAGGVTRAAECSAPVVPPLAEGKHTRQVTVDGRERSFVVHVPPARQGPDAAPLILAFHGGFGDPDSFARVTGLHAKGMAAGYVVVYPRGYRRSWNAGDCCGPAERAKVDDVAFVQALIDDLARVVRFDPERVYATGFSNGGKLTYRLACEMTDRLAAIAVVAAAISLPPETCQPSRPLPVLHIHGLADRYAPFAGGPSAFAPAGAQRSIRDTLALWTRRNGCAGESRQVFEQGALECTRYTGGAPQAEVTLWTIRGLAHQWPGGESILPRRLGPGTTDFSATDRILEFFHQHRRRPPQPRNRRCPLRSLARAREQEQEQFQYV